MAVCCFSRACSNCTLFPPVDNITPTRATNTHQIQHVERAVDTPGLATRLDPATAAFLCCGRVKIASVFFLRVYYRQHRRGDEVSSNTHKKLFTIHTVRVLRGPTTGLQASGAGA